MSREECLSAWCTKGTGTSNPVVLPRPIGVCTNNAELLTGNLRVDILIDSSGSLTGFSKENVIQPTYRWVRRAIQQLSAPPQRNVAVSGVWTFDEGHGVERLRDDIADYTISPYNTNLDDAISARAPNADAIVIITDGVPYVGGGTKKACAGSADPSCVAAEVLRFLNTNHDSGMWIVPLLADYDGPLDTEGQRVPLDDEYTKRITKVMRNEFRRGNQSEIELRVDRLKNELVWSGPKILVAFVLAKQQRFGRFLVWSLIARAADEQLPVLDASGTWQDALTRRSASAVGVLTPIEIYPGFVPTVQSLNAQQVPFPAGNETCAGVMTLTQPPFPKDAGNKATIDFTCGSDYGLRAFDVQLRTSSEPHCVQVYLVPSMRITSTDESGEYIHEKRVCIGDGKDATLIASIRLDLSCPGGNINESTIDVAGETSFTGVDEALRQATRLQPGALGYIRKFTTKSLPNEPFAVLGLDALVEQIVRGVRQDTKAAQLASLTVQRHIAPK
jgi:hypothetical protein